MIVISFDFALISMLVYLFLNGLAKNVWYYLKSFTSFNLYKFWWLYVILGTYEWKRNNRLFKKFIIRREFKCLSILNKLQLYEKHENYPKYEYNESQIKKILLIKFWILSYFMEK